LMTRAGGFALVDKALAHPPTTMLGLYDPPLYVSGWQPVTLASTSQHQGRLGVVGLVAFLERCEPTQQAKSFVAAWRGDDFAIDTTKSPTIVWRTVWKDEPSARRFADDVSTSGQCRGPG